MAERTLVENVAQAKADFKAVKDAVGIVIPEGTPTSEYGERIFNTISSLENEIENSRTEGIEQGKQEVISNSKYIEKTASGKVIRLDDVSEVYHNVKVYADTNTEVKVYGKNLFNNDTSLLKEVTYMVETQQSTRVGYEICGLPSGTYTFTLKTLNNADKFVYGVINDKDGNFVGRCNLLAQQASSTANFSPLTITVNEGDKIYIYNGIATSVANTIKVFENVQIQLSAYSTGGDFEEYQCQTITATPDGVEIPSNCPTMTFLADSDVAVDYFGSYSKHEFWTKYLSKQKASGLYSGFAGYAWTDLTFDPPFDIETNSSSSMFSFSFVEDLRGILAKNNAKIIFMNTSGAQHFNVFASSRLKYCPYLKLPETAMCYGFFTNCSRLIEVDGYECLEKHVFETSSGTNKTFQGCTNLVHIIFHGTIANNINLQWSKKLDMESLGSLFRCLKDFSNTDPDNAHTKTITLSAESWTLLDEYVYENGYNDYTSAQDVVLNVLGWNFA